ncbi:MAG: hypothetical protein Q7R56_02665 [Nanoarchaeota archaeon]|nr:hypothetical protein [Nanoarchaeota archaeon]
MKFDIPKSDKKNSSRYLADDLEVVRKFARILYKEFGSFLRVVSLFGSSIKNPGQKHRDLDVLIIVDDVRYPFSQEIVEAYRLIVASAIKQVDPQRLHVQSMKLTSWWEYVRVGDPVAINVLRYGVAVIDTGFFDPLQALLEQGRIRPTDESIWTYFTLAPASLAKSRENLLTAVVDLYWAAVDAAHAALMVVGEIPPNPAAVAELVELKLAGEGHIKQKHSRMMAELFRVFKGIVHRDIKEVSGKYYDELREKSNEFVTVMKEFIEKEKKK